MQSSAAELRSRNLHVDMVGELVSVVGAEAADATRFFGAIVSKIPDSVDDDLGATKIRESVSDKVESKNLDTRYP